MADVACWLTMGRKGEGLINHEGHHPVETSRHHHGQSLSQAVAVTALLVLIKAVGAVAAHSLALAADAAHSLGDIAALGLAWYADKQQERPPTEQFSFGWGRLEVLAGLLNALVLWLLSALFLWQAWAEWVRPVRVNAPVMAVAAAIALLINAALAWRFRDAQDFNRQSAFWHLLADAAGSLGVVLAAVVVGLTGWLPVNALVTVGIAVLMVWGGFGVIRDTLHVLLEAAPSAVPVADLVARFESVAGVDRVHDLHVWRVGSQQVALACHVELDEVAFGTNSQDILCQLHDMAATYGIEHTTIQLESAGESHPEPAW